MNYRFELNLTLECPFGCRDCARAVDQYIPPDSHVTLDQARRLVQQFEEEGIRLSRLKITGGEPCCNPQFEEICWEFSRHVPVTIARIKIQTAYTHKYVQTKYDLPLGLHIRSEPPRPGRYKTHHMPWFVSPTENGIIKPDEPPPFGSWINCRPCDEQKGCGRSFETWGFLACPQEGVLGRLLGIEVHTREFKPFAHPDVCRHCPLTLRQRDRDLMWQQVERGELLHISEVFQFDELKNWKNPDKW